MRFFAVAGASIVAMGVAGKVVREGGLRLAEKAGQVAEGSEKYGQLFSDSISTFRKIQDHLDALQGIERSLVDPDNGNTLVRRVGRTYTTDSITQIDSFAQRAVAREADAGVPLWSIRDDLQQRLVSQARRLPYELPGFYVAQKAFLDPIFGDQQTLQKEKVNWHNPVDVVGDFAWQGIKQLAGNVLPFEFGNAVASTGFKKLALQMAENPGNNPGFTSTRVILEQLGADLGDLFDRSIKFSQQTTGAFSSMVQASSDSSVGFTQWVKQRSSSALISQPNYKNANFAKRLFLQAQDITTNKDARTSALDMLPGPFKGMGTGMKTFADQFQSIGQTYNDMQEVMSGRVNLAQWRKNLLQSGDPANIRRVQDLEAYMRKGGGTHLEQYADAAYRLGKGGPTLPDGKPNKAWYGGEFYQNRSNEAYKSLVVNELSQKSGLTQSEALRFVGMADRVSPIPGSKAPYPGGENLIQRFQFTRSKYQGTDHNEWWQTVVRAAGQHQITTEGLSLTNFKEAVKSADSRFASRGYKALISSDIETEWNKVHGMIPQFATATNTSIKRPYEYFRGNAAASQRDFLIKRTAQKLGIDIFDQTGKEVPLNFLAQQITNRGLNANNLDRLKGYLIDQKEIAGPWSLNGRNIFGFRNMTIHEAMNNSYFAGRGEGVQKELSYITSQKTYEPIIGRGGHQSPYGMSKTSNMWDQKLNGVYVSQNGRVIDVGRVKRSLVAGLDRFANEYQVPLLHMKPLQTGGWSFFQSLRNQSPIIMESGTSKQLFNVGNENNPSFYLWMKAEANKSKGHIVSVSGDSITGITAQQREGLFRPLRTSVNSGMVGNYARIFIGDQGFPSSAIQDAKPDGTLSGKARFKRAFDVSQSQEDSLIGRNGVLGRWYGALRRREESMSNPYRAAEAFSRNGFNPAGMTSQESEGFDNMLDLLRNYGFSKNTLQQLSKDPRFQGIFQVSTTLGTNPLEIQSSLLPRMIKEIIEKDKSGLTGVEATKVGKLQQNLINLLNQSNGQNNYWDLPASARIKSTGISRRIDQLRSEFYSYLTARSQVVSTAGGTFSGTIRDLTSQIEELYTKGAISKAERTESRAAILSLQLENARNETYLPGKDYFPSNHNRAALKHAMENGNDVKSLLKEVGQFSQVHDPRFKHVGRFLRRNLTTTPYNVEGEINPFGGGRNLFVPTFGTAFRSNPTKAVKGLMGGSWSDPEAISGSTMMSTHLAMRLNRYFEAFNMGIDPTQYKGPMDFYARGIVGKRVLPIVAGASVALTADRTLGGYANPRDQNGNRVYSPYLLGTLARGVVEAQVGFAAAVPGGMTGEQKKEQLLSGEVPVRSGRYWLLGSSPFKGGRIQYFRPSWYERLKAGASYTPEMHDTPLERLMYGYDFSPLKPLDPYHYERQDYQSRPYPITGDYFTGPWGPLNGALNATIGRVLKPRKIMHQGELQYALQQYAPVGESGAYLSQTPIMGAAGSRTQQLASDRLASINAAYTGAGPGTSSAAPFYGSMGYAPPRGRASIEVRNRATQIAQSYQNLPVGGYQTNNSALVPYGVPSMPGTMTPRVISSGEAIPYGTTGLNARRLLYQTQEMSGIYGFATAATREMFGLGNKDLAPNNAILEPSSRGYSASRAFWGLNLGGLGDFSMPTEGRFSNIELSEVVRRFVPKEPGGTTYVNNLPNLMGQQYPWLPGADYPLAPLKTGDPYGQLTDAEIRLPGTGYMRTHPLFSDKYGQLGIANIHNILGNVAPWSQEYKAVDNMVDNASVSPLGKAQIIQTRAQVDSMRNKYEFTPYEHKYENPETIVEDPIKEAIGRGWEWFAHRDTFLNNKFLPVHTALEDWERNDVYGATFSSWEHPINGYLKPSVWKSTQRNPISGALAGGVLGSLFGASASAKAIGSVIGGTIGAAASLYGNAYEKIKGRRYLPMDRRKELALEENVDILSYVKNTVDANRALQTGDQQGASYFQQQAGKTMYGADLNGSLDQLAMAVPDRKREHFRAMLYAPEQERDQILSTAGRLERRLLESAWGRPVEQLPDLSSYFQDHELPPPDSSFWSQNASPDTIKIKMGQSMGLDMSQMGYYPQQIKEANLINPVYPAFFSQSAQHSIKSRLQRLLADRGIGGSVKQFSGGYSQNQYQLNAGVF